ncbi:MAG: aspartate dehydrogenase [Eubacteriales bacterium]|nr:aspartate dehydrogenase [Eubacteriales bacterium]
MRQDNGKIPYYQKHLKDTIPFDPQKQTPVIRASICTGEKVAGFKDKKTGHFVEVMMIRNEEEQRRFMQIYGIEQISTEY